MLISGTFAQAPLLNITDLSVSFNAPVGLIRAVDGLSLSVPRRTTVALVGESGCGKSVTALSILGLLPRPFARVESGRVELDRTPRGERVDLLALSEPRLRQIRGKRIAMIFQDPMSSLNPVLTVEEQMVETIKLHRSGAARSAREKAKQLLRQVQLEDARRCLRSYPHELSGGMIQRVMIALALACDPDLLIADEPTTALDVTVQAHILDLLARLQQEESLAILLVTHDFGVVARLAQHVYVMYAGRVVECAEVDAVFREPLHPYTQALIECTPRLAAPRGRLQALPGTVSPFESLPQGCHFHPRCRLSATRAAAPGRDSIRKDTAVGHAILRRCVEETRREPSGRPPLVELRPGHGVACWEAESREGAS